MIKFTPFTAHADDGDKGKITIADKTEHIDAIADTAALHQKHRFLSTQPRPTRRGDTFFFGCQNDRPIVLTTEEEGVASSCGAWLGGQKSVLLMQSSGVGNCINMLSLVSNCNFPFVTIVSMRGEWGEFNHWQVPMSRATPGSFDLMGIDVKRCNAPEEVAPTVDAALYAAFASEQKIAILLSQRLIGRKEW